MTIDYMDAAKDILAGCMFDPKDKIHDDATIADVKEIDSLTFETLVLEIERWAGKEVDPLLLLTLLSVRDLADVLARTR